MTYTVVWQASAEAELVRLWIAAADRGVISAAANEIDRALRRNPAQSGESRDANARILVVPPQVVSYEIREQDRLVVILFVTSLPERSA